MKNILVKALVIFITMFFIAACNQSDSVRSQPISDKLNKPTMTAKQEIVMATKQEQVLEDETQQWRQARVHFLNLEGGFYGLITEDGTKLLPMNLAKAYRQHGATIKFKGELKKGMLTIQQWGTPFKLTEVELVTKGKSLTDSL